MSLLSPSTVEHHVADDLAPLISALLGGPAPSDLPVRIRAWDASTIGPADAPLTIEIDSPDALRYLMWSPNELGLARAHIAGVLDIDGDIFDLLGVRDTLAGPGEELSLRFDPKGWVQVFDAARRLGVIGAPPPRPAEEAHLSRWRVGPLHGRRRDAAAISHHYDVGNDFYRMLLGPSMTYSCAYWFDDHTDLAGAQAAKHELICRKLDLQPGMRLLDVGCGWGSMVIHAAREHGVQAVGVTISAEQAELARQRVAEAGLSDQVEIRLQDYREIPDEPYDAISSIGMFEHVGEAKAAIYFGHLFDLLRPGGRLLNHAISRPDPDAHAGMDPDSFMARYVFPDGALLEVGTAASAMARRGYEVRDVQSLREHYAKTLRWWVANLQENWDEAQRLVGPGRARVWRLYLAGSAIGFEQGRTSVHQVLAIRPHVDGTSEMAATRRGIEITEAVTRR